MVMHVTAWLYNYHAAHPGLRTQAREIYRDDFKGVMTPPVLVDLTGDGVVDIVTSSYNSSVLAYDGATYRLLWNFTQPAAESYACVVHSQHKCEVLNF